MNNQTQTAIEAINHLARTERGRQALANPYWGELAIIAVIFFGIGALFGAAF